MGTKRLNELRDEFGLQLLDEMKRGGLTLAEACAVCIGACAALLVTVRDRKARRETAALLGEQLPVQVERRYAEIWTGTVN